MNIPEIFGENVFNDVVMRSSLPKEVYRSLRKTIDAGEPIDMSIADTVANANYRGADVEWYIKADDIVLKNKGGQPAGNPQNHAPQGQQKK